LSATDGVGVQRRRGRGVPQAAARSDVVARGDQQRRQVVPQILVPESRRQARHLRPGARMARCSCTAELAPRSLLSSHSPASWHVATVQRQRPRDGDRRARGLRLEFLCRVCTRGRSPAHEVDVPPAPAARTPRRLSCRRTRPPGSPPAVGPAWRRAAPTPVPSWPRRPAAFAAPGEVRREHGERGISPSWTASPDLRQAVCSA